MAHIRITMPHVEIEVKDERSAYTETELKIFFSKAIEANKEAGKTKE